jgi:hypothetical protein
MIFSVKRLHADEKNICLKTISSKAILSLVGSALLEQTSLSIVRMGDGERAILDADPTKPFVAFDGKHDDWNRRLGIDGEPLDRLQRDIIEAGNSCTYFAPSVSGISYTAYHLYQFFQPRLSYVDNFYVNDWTNQMIQMLLEASHGIYIIHRDYVKIIQNFQKNYHFTKPVLFDGCVKDSWKDNDEVIEAAIRSPAQLILFSAGPGGKIIGPTIAKTKNKIVLDVGNTLLPWSEFRTR